MTAWDDRAAGDGPVRETAITRELGAESLLAYRSERGLIARAKAFARNHPVLTIALVAGAIAIASAAVFMMLRRRRSS